MLLRSDLLAAVLGDPPSHVMEELARAGAIAWMDNDCSWVWVRCPGIMEQARRGSLRRRATPDRKQARIPVEGAPEFCVRDGGRWKIDIAQFAGLEQANPELTRDEIMAELHQAALWLEANKSRRKSASHMPMFLARWLRRRAQQQQGLAAVQRRINLAMYEER